MLLYFFAQPGTRPTVWDPDLAPAPRTAWVFSSTNPFKIKQKKGFSVSNIFLSTELAEFRVCSAARTFEGHPHWQVRQNFIFCKIKDVKYMYVLLMFWIVFHGFVFRKSWRRSIASQTNGVPPTLISVIFFFKTIQTFQKCQYLGVVLYVLLGFVFFVVDARSIFRQEEWVEQSCEPPRRRHAVQHQHGGKHKKHCKNQRFSIKKVLKNIFVSQFFEYRFCCNFIFFVSDDVHQQRLQHHVNLSKTPYEILGFYTNLPQPPIYKLVVFYISNFFHPYLPCIEITLQLVN